MQKQMFSSRNVESGGGAIVNENLVSIAWYISLLATPTTFFIARLEYSLYYHYITNPFVIGSFFITFKGRYRSQDPDNIWRIHKELS